MMGIIFSGYAPALESVAKDSEKQKALYDMGYHLGKWIYLVDAWDDAGRDIDAGAYNPLVYRYKYSRNETQIDFRNRIYTDCERNLLTYLAGMRDAYKKLEVEQNKAIIENIIYFGLLRKTDKVLGKDTDERQSI